MAAVKVRFLTRVNHGFKPDTPGHEPEKHGDNWTYSYQLFEEGDEFEFPSNEEDAVKQLVADGLAVRVTGKSAASE